MADLEVFELPGLTLTETSATVDGPIDRPSVLAAVNALLDRESMTKWQAGDLLAALVDDDDGDRARTFCEVDARRYSQAWLTSALLVSQRVAPELRRPALSWGHHEVVAGMEPDDQDTWLGRAHREGWSIRVLVQAIHDAAQPRLPGTTPPPKPPWRATSTLSALDRVLGSHGAAVVRADGTVAPFDRATISAVLEVEGRET